MHDVAYDDDRKGILQRSSRKHKQVGKTDDHTRDRVCHKCDAVDHFLHFPADRAPCRHQRRTVGHQRTGKGCDHRHRQGIEIHSVQLPVLEYRLHVLHRKIDPIGPFFDKGHDKHHKEHAERAHKDNRTQYPESHVSLRTLSDLDRRDPVISHIVFLQNVQHCDAHHRRDDHNKSHHRAVAEVRYTSQHLCVEDTCHNLKLSAHRSRDPEVRKAEEEGLDKRSRQCPQQRDQDRHTEGLQR